jgi:hypothetical protein
MDRRGTRFLARLKSGDGPSGGVNMRAAWRTRRRTTFHAGYSRAVALAMTCVSAVRRKGSRGLLRSGSGRAAPPAATVAAAPTTRG